MAAPNHSRRTSTTVRMITAASTPRASGGRPATAPQIRGRDNPSRMKMSPFKRNTSVCQKAVASNREAEEQAAAARELLRAVVEAEQRAVVALRDRGEIGDAALRAVLRDLDLEEQRLE